METFLSDQTKFQETAVKHLLKLIISQQKHISKVYKTLFSTNNISEETRRHLKPMGTTISDKILWEFLKKVFKIPFLPLYNAANP